MKILEIKKLKDKFGEEKVKYSNLIMQTCQTTILLYKLVMLRNIIKILYNNCI